MTTDELLEWVREANVPQRELVATISTVHGDAIRASPDADHQRLMRAIKKRINSASLRAERAALLASLARTYAPPPIPAMTRPELAAPIADWLVYGDALQAIGDPRGELVHLVHAVSEGRITADVCDAFVRAHWEALLGTTMTRHADAYTFEWQLCALRGATIRMTAQSQDLVARLMQAEASRDLCAVTLVGETSKDLRAVDLRPAMQQLLELAPDVTSFAFIDARAARSHSLTDATRGLVRLAPLAPFLARAEHLTLEVTDARELDFGDFVAPALRSFALRCLRFTDEGVQTMAARLASLDAPRLETFELRCVEHWQVGARERPRAPYVDDFDGDDDADGTRDDGTNDGVDWRQLDGLFAALAHAPLRRLALTSFDSAPSLLDALWVMRLPATLEELDLSDSRLDAANVDWLLDRREVFGKLARLRIERVSLAPADAVRLEALGPAIVYSHDARSPAYRDVSSWE